MNRLYVIKWEYKGYPFGVSCFWKEREAKEMMQFHQEWKYELEEATEAHKIWIAR